MPEKQHELDHVAVEMDVTIAVTAVEDDVTSSAAASSSLTTPASQAQNMNVNHFHLNDLVRTLRRGAYAFLRLNSTTIFQVFWSSGNPIQSFTADWLHPATREVRKSNCCDGCNVKMQTKLSISCKTFCRSVFILGYEHFSWSEYFECGNRRFCFVFAKNQNLTTP